MSDMEDYIYEIDNIINHIRSNTIDLMSKKYSKQQVLTNGIIKGKSILTGSINKQNIIDLSAICIAILLFKS